MAKSKSKAVEAIDPRQALFLTYYLNPESPTFSNALQSGIKAGYSQEYSESIMSLMPAWLSEKIGNSPLLLKAERNLDKILDLETNLHAIGAFGPLYERIDTGKRDKKGKPIYKQGKKIMREHSSLLKIKADVSEFVAERVGKAKYGKESENGGNKTLVIIVSPQSASRYGATPSPTEHSVRPA